MADLNFFTLKYKQAERERKVSAGGPGWLGVRGSQGILGMWVQLFAVLVLGGCPWHPFSWKLAADGLFLCLLVPPASGRVFHQRCGSALILAALFGLVYLLIIRL